ncbi:MAG: hypothetical protein KatS3mg103_0470 [Phycisphaerales bacterium]|nr:MAG: hypothetical protein KatS3mg103_0470 [Phycisphaerales bacterium]
MRVQRVEILRSPGIDEAFAVEGLADGLAIVLGRNESGKTTLARAIGALLFSTVQPGRSARGRFADARGVYDAYTDPHGAGWTGDRPILPGPSARRSLIVGIADLWQADEHHQSVVEAMQRELLGGYDLHALRPGKDNPGTHSAKRQLERALNELHEARRQAEKVRQDRARLPELESRAQALQRSVDRGVLVERALERLDAQEALREAEARLASYPPGALRVRGDERERLDGLDAQLRKSQAAADRADQEAKDADEQLGRLDLPDVDRAKEVLAQLVELEAQAKSLADRLTEARRQADQAQQEVRAAGLDPDRLVPSDSHLDQADAAWRPLGLDDQKLEAIDRALQRVQEARERSSRLRAEAEAAQDQARPTSPAGTIWLWAGAVLVLAALVVWALVSGAWVGLGLSIIALGVVLTLAAGSWRASDRVGRPQQEDARRRAEAAERAHEEEVQKLRSVVGDAGKEVASALSLVVAAGWARRMDDMAFKLIRARADAESLRSQLDEVLGRAGQALASLGRSPDRSPGAGLAALVAQRQTLEGDIQRAEALADRRARAIERTREAEQQIENILRERQAMLEKLELTEDRLHELDRWLELREQALESQEHARAAKAAVAAHDQALADHDDLRSLDRPALRDMLERIEQDEGELERLREEVGRIKGSIEGALHRHDVAEALESLERAADEVARLREEACRRQARALVLEEAAHAGSQRDLPELIRRADELLGRFTRGAYALRVDDRGVPGFVDLRSGRAKSAEALSSGTLAQALLAVRLAAAVDAEARAGCEPLPLVLDEPLATSDAERFEAVAGAVLDLVGQQRQVVYLTCDPSHAARLQRLAQAQQVACRVHDLDAIRTRQATESLPDWALEPIAQASLPDPASVGRQAYLQRRGGAAVAPLGARRVHRPVPPAGRRPADAARAGPPGHQDDRPAAGGPRQAGRGVPLATGGPCRRLRPAPDRILASRPGPAVDARGPRAVRCGVE